MALVSSASISSRVAGRVLGLFTSRPPWPSTPRPTCPVDGGQASQTAPEPDKTAMPPELAHDFSTRFDRRAGATLRDRHVWTTSGAGDPVRILLVVLVVALSGCAGSRPVATEPPTKAPTIAPAAPTQAPTQAPTVAGAGCALNATRFSELQDCHGTSEQLSLKIPDSNQGKTLAHIAVAAKDPQQILSALGAYATEWRGGVHSFTVWAWGSKADKDGGGGYNRGMLFWNDDGPINVQLCTTWSPLGGIDLCDSETTLTLEND